ncbi:MAG TPA: glycosyl hydrolase family 28-related protein [Chthoniobacterales bacterium]|nr:glycosyl hydrolase family 28-related protein [Chthoniobacterales bacterium]
MKAIALSIFSFLLLGLATGPSAMAAVDRINVTSVPYNAVPDDGIDDTAAINAAISAGKSIYFPAGTYDFTGQMVLPANSSYRLYGEGPGVSTIRFTGPSAGINAPNMGLNTLNVDNLTLWAKTMNCGTAISASFNEFGANTKFRTATIVNVQITGSERSGGSGGYWTNGIYLYRAQNSVIDKVHIWGNIRPAAGSEADASLTGIVWESSNTYATTGLQLSDLEITFVNTALRTNGWVEGLYLNRFEFVQCGQHGVPAVDLNSFDSVNRKPTFHLVNGHVDLIQNGIRLTNLRGIRISKVLLLHNGGAERNGSMVIFNNCFDAMVSQCTFLGGTHDAVFNVPLTDETGILLDNADSVQVTGNWFAHMTTPTGAAIAIQPTSSVVRITNNIFTTMFGGGVNHRYDDQNPDPNDPYFRGDN